jgi:hypothetical protein
LRGGEGPFGRFEKFCEVVAVVLPGRAYGEAAVGAQGVRIICSNRGILVMLGPFLPTRPFSRMLTAAAVVPLVVAGMVLTPASASTVSSAVFTGGSGTASVGGILYARQGAPLTLTVTTSSDTQCVDVAGAFTAHQSSQTAKVSWVFTTTAGTGDGAKVATVSV